MKKLIFLRDGLKYKLPKNLRGFVYNIDFEVYMHGYKATVEEVEKSNCEWFQTLSPAFMSSIDWWNEDEQKFEIYIPIKNNKLKNIHEFTDKEIRHAHNIERMFLAGVFDD